MDEPLGASRDGCVFGRRHGFGKNVAVLAVLLNRGSKSPALVIAPTSVASNWQAEIAKFAPSLNTVLFSESERDMVVESLGKRDILICGYGLLAIEAERLQSRTWHTVVLDEAQAIKNADTPSSTHSKTAKATCS